MPRKSLENTVLAQAPGRNLVELAQKSAMHQENAVAVGELMDQVAMSFAPHLDRADVRALVDRLAFA